VNSTKFILLAFVFSLGLVAANQGAPRLQEGSLVSEIALTDLGAEPFEVLQGPFDEVHLTFQVPANWQVQDFSSLNLSLQNFFSSFVPAQGEVNQEALIAGNINLVLDGNLIFRSVLSVSGQQDLSIPLSPAMFSAPQRTHELIIRWDASASCDLNLSSTILIRPESALVLTHADLGFSADLSQLPFPFFSHHALEDTNTLIVLPASANETQVAAALSAAASLGRSVPEDDIRITTEDRVTDAELSSHNLIFVGQVESFTSLDGVSLPHADNDRLNLPISNRPELGYIELTASPWNPSLGLLVVSGTTDAALLKAAVQSGSGELVLNSAGNLALVEPDSELSENFVDLPTATFAQLTQEDATFESFGNSQIEIPFYVSPDRAVSENAFLDLRFAHSQLLDYLRSSLTVSINAEPVSGVRLADQSAARHSELILLSPSVLKPGLNHLQIAASVVPLNSCASETESNHWLTIYSDSSLNLPSAEEQTQPSASHTTFAQFPAPFLQDQMQNITLLVPSNAPEYWSAAAQLLRGLAATQWPLLPDVRYAGAVSASSLENRNLIFLGSFDDFLNDAAVASAFSIQPLSAGHGQITLSSGQTVAYEPGTELSFLGVGQIEGSSGAALAVFSSSPASLAPAITLLTDPAFEQGSRNTQALVIQGATVIRDNGAQAAAAPAETATPTDQPAAPVSTGKGWWLGLVGLLFFAAFLLLVWGELSAFIKSRVQKK